MTTGHEDHRRAAEHVAGSRPRRRAMPLLALALLGWGATACGDSSGDEDSAADDVVTGSVDFEATPDFLAAASRRSNGEPYRIESSMAMHAEGEGQDISVEATLQTGEQDGERYEYHMDLEEYLDQLPSGARSPFPASADLTQDMASDGTTLYLRAPLYAALVEEAPDPADVGPMGELAALGDGWGRIDLRALGDLSIVEAQSTAGAPASGDPRALLDLVAGAAGVEELGADEIDGEPVNGLGAPRTLRELIDAQGADPERFVDQLAANIGGLQEADPAVLTRVMDTMMAMEIPFEVWVDRKGYVRRLSFEYDMVELMRSLRGDQATRGIDTFTVGSTIDYFDYGDESIQVELPPEGAANAPDVTDAYRRMLEAGQGG